VIATGGGSGPWRGGSSESRQDIVAGKRQLFLTAAVTVAGGAGAAMATAPFVTALQPGLSPSLRVPGHRSVELLAIRGQAQRRGSGDWRELRFGINNITPATPPMRSPIRPMLVIKLRLAADAAGATKMDLPGMGRRPSDMPSSRVRRGVQSILVPVGGVLRKQKRETPSVVQAVLTIHLEVHRCYFLLLPLLVRSYMWIACRRSVPTARQSFLKASESRSFPVRLLVTILDNSARCPMPVRNEEKEDNGCVEYMGVIITVW
jgi:hypothetical protein